jgi:hypothetical protein
VKFVRNSAKEGRTTFSEFLLNVFTDGENAAAFDPTAGKQAKTATKQNKTTLDIISATFKCTTLARSIFIYKRCVSPDSLWLEICSRWGTHARNRNSSLR